MIQPPTAKFVAPKLVQPPGNARPAAIPPKLGGAAASGGIIQANAKPMGMSPVGGGGVRPPVTRPAVVVRPHLGGATPAQPQGGMVQLGGKSLGKLPGALPGVNPLVLAALPGALGTGKGALPGQAGGKGLAGKVSAIVGAIVGGQACGSNIVGGGKGLLGKALAPEENRADSSWDSGDWQGERRGKGKGKGKKGKGKGKGKGKFKGKGKGEDGEGGDKDGEKKEGEEGGAEGEAKEKSGVGSIVSAQREARQREEGRFSPIVSAQRDARMRFEKDVLDRIQGRWVDETDSNTTYVVEGNVCSVSSGDGGRGFRNRLSVYGVEMCWDARRFWHYLNLQELYAAGDNVEKLEWNPAKDSPPTQQIVWLKAPPLPEGEEEAKEEDEAKEEEAKEGGEEPAAAAEAS
mmetsp:Transcript_73776/g.186550  ORF Transcript_73776/g.186550 Transcript_73776/m.186550 type:complete len:404 (-) Transcript_73776:413-1624(-)